MPSSETTARTQKAVLWAANGYGDYSEPKIDAPVEIDVRWETKRREVVDALGNTVATDAVVVVDQEIAVGSVMWLGEFKDLPSPVTNLKQVVAYSDIPDIKGRESRRTVSLIKYSDELPVLAS